MSSNEVGIAFKTIYGPNSGKELTDNEKVLARKLIVDHESFLQTLCDVPNNRAIGSILANATDADLNVLGYVIFLINIHEIGMAKRNRDQLIKCRKYERLRSFIKHKPDFDYFLSLSRKEKLDKLKTVGCGLPIVLRNLFYDNPGEELRDVDHNSRVQQEADRNEEKLTIYPSKEYKTSEHSKTKKVKRSKSKS